MEGWELEAREQIRDLVARYNSLGDSGRFEDLLDLFADDARLTVGAESHIGTAQIRAMFIEAAEGAREQQTRFVRHFTSTHQLDLASPSLAIGRCYFQTLTQYGLDHWGRYLDEYRPIAGCWRFASRTVEVEGARAGGWGEPFTSPR